MSAMDVTNEVTEAFRKRTQRSINCNVSNQAAHWQDKPKQEQHDGRSDITINKPAHILNRRVQVYW